MLFILTISLPGLILLSNRKPLPGKRSTKKQLTSMSFNLSPRYCHVILVV